MAELVRAEQQVIMPRQRPVSAYLPYTPTLDWDTLLTTFRTHSVPDVKAVKQGRV